MKNILWVLLAFFSYGAVHASTGGNLLPLFMPKIQSDGHIDQKVELKKSTIKIQIDGFFAEISVEWEFESTRAEASSVLASFRLPPTAVLDRFQWERDGEMIDATPTHHLFADDSFDMERLKGVAVASLTGSHHHYRLGIYPISEGRSQKVRIHCVMPVPFIDGTNQFSIPAEAFWFKGITDIEISIPGVEVQPHFLRQPLENAQTTFDETGWRWQGVVEKYAEKEEIRFAWQTPSDHVMVMEKNGEWFFAIREALQGYPQFRWHETPRSSRESLVYLGPMDLSERDNRCRAIARYLNTAISGQDVTIVPVHGGRFAPPSKVRLDQEPETLELALLQASKLDPDAFTWSLSPEILENKLVWLFLSRDQMPPQWPTLSDDIGYYFDPMVLFGEAGRAHFGNSLVWDGRIMDRLDENKPFTPHFHLEGPSAALISGPTYQTFYHSSIVSETIHRYDLKETNIKVPQLLRSGRLKQLPASITYAWPGMITQKTLPIHKRTFARGKALERWMFPSEFRNRFQVRSDTRPRYSFEGEFRRSSGGKVGFLAFDHLETYREYELDLPPGGRFTVKERDQFRLDKQGWPKQKSVFLSDLGVDTDASAPLDVVWGSKAGLPPYDARAVIVVNPSATSKELFFYDGKAYLGRLPFGTYDILLKVANRRPILLPQVEISDNKRITLQVDMGPPGQSDSGIVFKR